MSQVTRKPFDPAPVVAEMLHLLAHPDELHPESSSGCGTCAMTGRLRNPNSGREERCQACAGRGIR